MQAVHNTAMTARRLFTVGLTLVTVTGTSALAQEKPAQTHDIAEARELIGQAEQIASKIDKSVRGAYLLSVAEAKAQAGDYEGARVMARALGTDEEKAAILQEIAVDQALKDGYDTASKTVGGIKAPERKVNALTAIAAAMVQKGRKKEATLFLSDSMDALDKIKDGAAAIPALYKIGKGLARAGEPTVTSKLAGLTKGDILAEQAGGALYAIAKAFNGDIAGAKKQLPKIVLEDYQMDALQAIAEVQVKSGDKAGAAVTWKQMIEVARSTAAVPLWLVNIATLQRDLGDSAAATATMRSALAVATKNADDTELGEVADGQAKLGDIENALKTLANVKVPFHQCDARGSIAFFKAKRGDVAAALEMNTPAQDPMVRVYVLLGAARGIVESLKPAVKP